MTIRCEWTGDDPLMVAYHDDEWGKRSKRTSLKLTARLPVFSGKMTEEQNLADILFSSIAVITSYAT